ncbi:MAG: alpha-glucosidase [Myxococcota bacterium]|nr:alpha-glucosidase [Myxococcota bacterium]
MNSINASTNGSWAVGDFEFTCVDLRLALHRRDRPDFILWSIDFDSDAVSAAIGVSDVTESRGFFDVKDKQVGRAQLTSVDEITLQEDRLFIVGRLTNKQRWLLTFEVVDDCQVRFDLSTSDPTLNRLTLRSRLSDASHIYGFGEQFTHLNMAGRVIPVLSQEPGIGRGVQPLTWVMNTAFKAGGEWHNSNAPMPWFLTSGLQSFCLENKEYSVFDFSVTDRVCVHVFASTLCGRIFFGDSPMGLVSAYSRYSGRMRALPPWIGQGAVIGMQGGTEAVRELHRKLQAVAAPVSAFWLQDWVGARKTSVGWQLWWNWELDEDRYPNWDDLRTDLSKDDVRLMTYINPFLVDPAEKGSFKRNLFQEANELGYLIKRDDGSPYMILNTSFSAAMVDLANPDAYEWLKSVIKDELLTVGSSGWMADFGEALPFDAVLHDGINAESYHNEYPEIWAKLNREAIEEAGLGNEIVFFMRSGFTRSPKYCTLFWMGDQLTSWRVEDGIKSTLIAMLSSGMSGMSINHSDIGGYTATTVPSLPFQIPGIGYVRQRELLMRWIELNAMTPVFRTHEGNQPSRHHQIDSDHETLEHFARFARLYAALADYRQVYFEQAADQGHPVIRHMWLAFPDDKTCLDLDLQFMLGDDILFAPVLDPKTDRVDAYLPNGDWTHLWSEKSIATVTGEWVSVSAPIGQPAIFCRTGCDVYAALRIRLAQSGDLVSAQSGAVQIIKRH